MQIGAPLEVYRNPVNTFVAKFLGSPPMNFLSSPDRRRRERISVQGGWHRVAGRMGGRPGRLAALGGQALIGIRPEDIYEVPRPPGRCADRSAAGGDRGGGRAARGRNAGGVDAGGDGPGSHRAGRTGNEVTGGRCGDIHGRHGGDACVRHKNDAGDPAQSGSRSRPSVGVNAARHIPGAPAARPMAGLRRPNPAPHHPLVVSHGVGLPTRCQALCGVA